MEILTQTELQLRGAEIANRIKKGAVFIHPTDTIYGLSCDASNKDAVKRIREIKNRPDSPFSVWVPSIKWIENNCVINKEGEKWLKELPGPYTLITKLKNKNAISKEVIPKTDNLGVRLPNHWLGEFIRLLNIPFVSTSANKAGQPFMTSLRDLDPEVETRVDFAIYEGEKKSRPSKIVHLVEDNVKER